MKLVVFDIDGTLVDSQNEIVEAQTRAFAANGLTAPTRERALSVVGLSLAEAFLNLAGPTAPLDNLAAAYIVAWTDIRLRPGYRDPLYPGAAAIIAGLAQTPDFRLGIATGKSRRGVDRILATQGWTDLFVTIQTADTHPSKPDPSMLQAAMAEVGASAEETVMVGDTTYDMQMASSVGAWGIGVGWGYHEPAMLKAAGAFTSVASFDALRGVLETFGAEATA